MHSGRDIRLAPRSRPPAPRLALDRTSQLTPVVGPDTAVVARTHRRGTPPNRPLADASSGAYAVDAGMRGRTLAPCHPPSDLAQTTVCTLNTGTAFPSRPDPHPAAARGSTKAPPPPGALRPQVDHESATEWITPSAPPKAIDRSVHTRPCRGRALSADDSRSEARGVIRLSPSSRWRLEYPGRRVARPEEYCMTVRRPRAKSDSLDHHGCLGDDDFRALLVSSYL